MNIYKRFLLSFFVTVVSVLAFSTGYGKSISICSFNIQFLGQSTKRDNAALCNIIKDYDIVVIEEILAPPYLGKFPNGDNYKPDPQVTEFFNIMIANGFTYYLSEEDTGPGAGNHKNSNATEWWVAFYKQNAVSLADDLPIGFLAADRTANSSYDRVPYAFPFRTISKKLDFVLIPVHLHPNDGPNHRKRRKTELTAIYKWIGSHNSNEKDFIVLGDMNIENKQELDNLNFSNTVSLNNTCVRTNTLINQSSEQGAKPYDHVFYNTKYTQNEIDTQFGFNVVNLVEKMKNYWHGPGSYPGDPYKHDVFRVYYSDHNPVVFKMVEQASDDD